MKLTMTVAEVARELHQFGMRASPTYVANAIESGHFPFGRLVSTGAAGRRTFEIFRVDFQRWLEERIPEQQKGETT